MDSMEEGIHRLESLTHQFSKKLEQASYENIVEFVEQRQRLIEQLQRAELTEGDKRKYRNSVEKIIQIDAVVSDKIKSLQEEAGIELEKRNHVRRQKNAYNAAYSQGSFFLDQRN